MSDKVNCTHSSYVANLLYKLELIITNGVYSTQCWVVNIQSDRLGETSLCDGVNCTHSSCVANLLYKFELIIINGACSAECRAVNIQSEPTERDIIE